MILLVGCGVVIVITAVMLIRALGAAGADVRSTARELRESRTRLEDALAPVLEEAGMIRGAAEALANAAGGAEGVRRAGALPGELRRAGKNLQVVGAVVAFGSAVRNLAGADLGRTIGRWMEITVKKGG